MKANIDKGSAKPYQNTFLSRLLSNKLSVLGLVIIIFWVVAGFVSLVYLPYNPEKVDTPIRLMAPSLSHFMGTDNFGRDIFSRVLSGSRISLWLGFSSVLISLVIGSALGSFAGYYEKRIGNIIMRIMDALQAFPLLVLVMSISIALGRNSFSAMLAVGIGGVPQFARLMYAQTLAVKNSPFIEGERAIGMKGIDILIRHIFPNCLTPLLVRTTLSLGFSILTISSLSYLGIGVQPPTPEWGAMISEARDYILSGEWWLMLFPGLGIASLVTGFNLLGDGLRDAFDYRMQ